MRRPPHLGQVTIILCIFLPLCSSLFEIFRCFDLSWIWCKVEIYYEYIFRICKNILASVRGKGAIFQRVFEFCFEYKLYWYLKGKETPILDRLVFNKVRQNAIEYQSVDGIDSVLILSLFGFVFSDIITDQVFTRRKDKLVSWCRSAIVRRNSKFY